MNELVERYVHHVGRYLPPNERADIEIELRSQIADQIDDRFGGEATPEDIALVLAELGHPYEIAMSYRDQQYLIGPDLYPVMMAALKYGWFTVPVVVLFLNIFGVLTSTQPVTFMNVLIEPLLAAAYAAFIFSAVVVLIFAILQRGGINLKGAMQSFDPRDLAEIDDPRNVDRFESAIGITFGSIVLLMLLYWLSVGGLTLNFSLNQPDDVIPVPVFWMIFLIVIVTLIIFMHLLAVLRGHWGVWSWLLETIIELVGVFGMYFVLYKPVFERIFAGNPALIEIPLVASAPQIIAVATALLALAVNARKFVRLWNYRTGHTTSFFIKADSR